MIAILGLFGLACLVVVSVWVGVRLMFLAKRTRELPEALLGVGLFLTGGPSVALGIAPLLISDPAGETAHWILRAAVIASALGAGTVYVFVWYVFRRTEIWGRLLLAALSLALLVATVGDLATREAGQQLFGPNADLGPFGVLSVFPRILASVWAAWESFSYCAMMKRRAAIGLADESLALRFWYWGVAMCAAGLAWVAKLVDSLLGEANLAPEVGAIVMSLMGFLGAYSIFQAFFSKSQSHDSSESNMRPEGAA